MLQRVRKGIMFYAPINVNPAMGGGGGGRSRAWVGMGYIDQKPRKDKANISGPCNLTPWSFIVSRHWRWPDVVLHIFIFLILKLS